MSFLIFAAPIIFIIIIVIFAVVMLSDSKSYKKNLSNSKQMELERAREEALKAIQEMRRIKEGTTSTNDTYTHTPESKSLHEQKTLVQKENLERQKSVAREKSLEKRQVLEKEKSLREQKTSAREQSLAKSAVQKEVVNKYQQYYNENCNKGVNKFKQQAQFRTTEASEAEPKLVFSKENLVRGLIAKEYLNRKAGRRL